MSTGLPWAASSSSLILASLSASCLRHLGELGLQFLVLVLRGQRLRPVKGEVEVAAAVVDLADLAGRRLVVVEELGEGLVHGHAQQLGLGIVEGGAQVLQGGAEGRELAERIPAQVAFLDELLDVLGGRAAGAGLEQAATGQQRDDGEHLGAGAQFHDREEVGQVVAQHVAGHRDGVLPLADPGQGELHGIDRRHDVELQPFGVMVLQIFLDLGDDVGVVRPVLVEPEDRRRAGGAGAVARPA